jgi:hypothetical protein
MNKHLANSILGARALMDSIPEISAKPLMPFLRVSGVFDKQEHRASATTCLTRISNQIPNDIPIHSDWWLLGNLNRNEYFKLASRTGHVASMLWYAGYAGPSQLRCLEQWIIHTSLGRSSARAFVALIADHSEDEMGCLRFIVQLQSIANDNGLAFFYQHIPSSEAKGIPSVESKGSNLVKPSFNFLGRSQLNDVRHFGISE